MTALSLFLLAMQFLLYRDALSQHALGALAAVRIKATKSTAAPPCCTRIVFGSIAVCMMQGYAESACQGPHASHAWWRGPDLPQMRPIATLLSVCTAVCAVEGCAESAHQDPLARHGGRW